MNEPDLTLLRTTLENLADKCGRFSEEDPARLNFYVKDIILETLRLNTGSTDAQLHQLRQLLYRLEMLTKRDATFDSITRQAQRTLAAFGWKETATGRP